ncbi:hypothetical protein [Nocardioides sp. zg-DK7169]|uniref:hypothetical protein n=1 Tax=Nocardioides sp. zg-DK7169 TaxID=2736600 RepID=UPI001555E870|nr:hypothetical protein [Nocardioides sp. zg-DK7169]NPC98365.1 hypothetical protein [Nocardioides sp. zg-DK7169]
MSEHSDEPDGPAPARDEASGAPSTGISDEELPEDLRPAEDNPLAEPLEPGERVEGLLEEGKRATESTGDAGGDEDGADRPAAGVSEPTGGESTPE